MTAGIMLSPREKSKKIYEKACQVIPGGVCSPVRAFNGLACTPLIVSHAKDDLITEVEEKSYIDYCMSWGALILGHAHPVVVKAACEQIERGSSYGATTPFEEQLSSSILVHFPWIDKMRFVSSGTEATMTALRLARAYTGRNMIIKFDGNYHGHSDQLLVKAGSGLFFTGTSSSGIPAEMISTTLSLPYNDVATFTRVMQERSDIAAVIFEPVVGNMGVVPPKPEFLQALRYETEKKGTLLIADEVITGFRVGIKGAQGLYNFQADIVCLGKIIGGGFPAAAFGARAEIMDLLAPLGPVYQAGTLSGNPVAMAAGCATLRAIERPGFYEELEQKTRLLLDPIEAWIAQSDRPLCLQRVGSMWTLFFGVRKVESRADLAAMDEEAFRHFFIELFERGVYLPPSPYEAAFISQAHSNEHLIYTRDTILELLAK